MGGEADALREIFWVCGLQCGRELSCCGPTLEKQVASNKLGALWAILLSVGKLKEELESSML